MTKHTRIASLMLIGVLASAWTSAQTPGTMTVVYRSGSTVPVNDSSRLSLLTLTEPTTGNVSFSSNRDAGGAVWSWKYKGVEFINNGNCFGGIMQSAAFIDPMTNANSVFGGKTVINPTEAGASGFGADGLTPPSGQIYPDYNQSSSLIAATNTSSTTQSTYCIPLDYIPVDFGGDFDTNAIEWSDFRFGKTVTLNWRNHPDVARYEAYLLSPVTLQHGVYVNAAHMTIPSIYVNANFSVLYTVALQPAGTYATTASYSAVTNPSPGGSIGFTPAGSTYNMAAIVSDPNTGKSMGVYMPSQSRGGSVESYSWWNLTQSGQGTGPQDYNSYALYPAARIEGLTGNVWASYRVFIVCGDSPAQVANEMAWLNWLDDM